MQNTVDGGNMLTFPIFSKPETYPTTETFRFLTESPLYFNNPSFSSLFAPTHLRFPDNLSISANISGEISVCDPGNEELEAKTKPPETSETHPVLDGIAAVVGQDVLFGTNRATRPAEFADKRRVSVAENRNSVKRVRGRAGGGGGQRPPPKCAAAVVTSMAHLFSSPRSCKSINGNQVALDLELGVGFGGSGGRNNGRNIKAAPSMAV
ncbi:hypothetical protein JRO89_XS09G0005400 [Xanthoceras sorbifolium]|uniref:Uncharacterized protein n=1 Tax=Xanthoceras sorbifolium TaxID=99658 RepID=A0ABQ8HK01_9ROSI|nr:hypothetical protein JRO89_XS09G0005400 [Xanthoceras sorbifolium]